MKIALFLISLFLIVSCGDGRDLRPGEAMWGGNVTYNSKSLYYVCNGDYCNIYGSISNEDIKTSNLIYQGSDGYVGDVCTVSGCVTYKLSPTTGYFGL